jgi:hypothetical protein
MDHLVPYSQLDDTMLLLGCSPSTSLAEIDLHRLNHCRLHTDSNTQRLRCGQLTSVKLIAQEPRLVAEPVEALHKAGLFRRYVLPSIDE